jgi:hypothetical protein
MSGGYGSQDVQQARKGVSVLWGRERGSHRPASDKLLDSAHPVHCALCVTDLTASRPFTA